MKAAGEGCRGAARAWNEAGGRARTLLTGGEEQTLTGERLTDPLGYIATGETEPLKIKGAYRAHHEIERQRRLTEEKKRERMGMDYTPQPY